jgi:hypothetical protein
MLFVKQPSSTHIACLAFVFSLLCPFLLFGQENPDSLLAYYPLHIGNIWEYEEVEYDEFMLPVSTDYFRIRVIGDTLMPNAHTYRVLEYHKLLNRETELKYERVDSTTGNVYRFLPDLDTDLLLDSLFSQPYEYSLANRFGTASLRTVYYGETVCPIFERLFMCKEYSVETAIPITYYLTKDIGLTFYTMGEGTSGIITDIIYAHINGEEYGERASVSIVQDPGNIPVKFGLIRNYPNPFNPATRIIYRLDQSGPVTLELYDIHGRRVARLVEDGNRSAGTHTVEWNARGMASGMYLAVLRNGTAVDTMKILLVR